MRIDREELLHNLEMVEKGLGKKEEAGQNHCFTFRDGEVITFNDEISCRLEGDFGFEGVVEGAPLLAMLRKMKSKELDIKETGSDDKSGLMVKSKGERAMIRLMKDVKTPIEDLEKPSKWRKLPDGYREAVAMTGACAKSERSDERTVLGCVNLNPDCMEGCDDQQLIRHTMKTPIKRPALIDSRAARHIKDMKATKCCLSDSWLHFKNEDGVLMSCRLFEQEYPELDPTIEVEGPLLTLPKSLSEALEKAQVFSDESGGDLFVTLRLRKGEMRIRSEGDSGWYECREKISYEGDEMKFQVSPILLAELSKKSQECVVGEGRLKADTDQFVYVTSMGVVDELEDE